MCRAHCHRIIKLSGTLEPVAPEKELVENVHGVRGTFVETGVALRKQLGKSHEDSDPVFGAAAEPKIYFIGKMLWSKGLGSLMELLKFAEETTDLKVTIDMYGGGPDMKAAAAKATKLGLDMPFHGPLDHAELAFTHKVFVNPSTSEVLCTTSAEALAMGKFLILPSHPSNDFFTQFPNCLAYSTKEEFVANLYYAITHEPEPLSDEYARALGWEAATDRLAAAACIPVAEATALQETLASDKAAVEVSAASSKAYIFDFCLTRGVRLISLLSLKMKKEGSSSRQHCINPVNDIASFVKDYRTKYRRIKVGTSCSRQVRWRFYF